MEIFYNKMEEIECYYLVLDSQVEYRKKGGLNFR